MWLIIWLVTWLISAGFTSYIAREKNRNSIYWFWLGFLFGIFALIAIAAVPSLPDRTDLFSSTLPSGGIGSRSWACPSCQQINGIGTTQCSKCGYQIKRWSYRYIISFPTFTCSTSYKPQAWHQPYNEQPRGERVTKYFSLAVRSPPWFEIYKKILIIARTFTINNQIFVLLGNIECQYSR